MEKHETEYQISFIEVDGKFILFNKAEAVAAEDATDEIEPPVRKKRKTVIDTHYLPFMITT